MTSTGGYQAACRLFAASDPPDAVLCIDDSTAFGALHAAHEQGLVIGQAVGIAGFDGTQESLHTQPPLTTLDIPIYDMARRLVRMLLEALGDRNRVVPGEVIVPELRVRASTGGSG
jgi:LacI family transcriptional regulator